MEELGRTGVIVCLTANAETIFERTRGSSRPLLKAGDPLAKIKEMLKSREDYYKRCQLMIDTSGLTPEQVADRIIESKLLAF